MERIAIVGAGVAGLGAAMALARVGREILVIDRDPPPPENIETAFGSWERKGVTQLRHSHMFLGCLFALIRDRHPRLHEMLRDAGARVFDFEAGLPRAIRNKYVPAADDCDLVLLFARRTTLEHTMRAYVETLPGVTFLANTIVRDLMLDTTGAVPVAHGVLVERGAVAQELPADVVVDASGRNSILIDRLRDRGVVINEEESPAGILYFTRHYRIRDGQEEPPRDVPGAGDLGYLKYGVFAADNRHFSITLCVPEIETELRVATLNPTIFHTICNHIPAVARWVDPIRAEPVTRVFSMGNLHNVWRRFANGSEPVALNFFAIGDAAVRTNPLYGRGCSSAVVHAHTLADTLNQIAEPRERAVAFGKRTERDLRPFWTAIKRQDLGAIRRAKNQQDPTYKPRLKARVVKSFAEDAIGPATRSDLSVYRAIIRSFHMFAVPTAWLRRPSILLRVLATWITPRSRKLYSEKLGPERNEMLRALGLIAA